MDRDIGRRWGECPLFSSIFSIHKGPSCNTRRWLVGSSLPAWNALDMIKIARPVRNVIDPILSKGRSD
jgi:hypothetical protein